MSNSIARAVHSRLRTLMSGPWFEEGALAEQALEPPNLPDEATLADQVRISLADARLPPSQKLEWLAEALRFHWDEEVNDDLFDVRASMDEALGFLQLLELAVATGYLPLEEVWVDARRRLSTTLWAGPARNYVQGYGFFGVRLLAARVNVDLGLPVFLPPPPQPHGAIRFAAMLSELRLWYEDGPLDRWLDLLDDFVSQGVDKSTVAAALRHRETLPANIAGIVAGADLFVERLSNLFEMLPVHEQPLYGVYFSYWLAKFFGKDIRADRIEWAKTEPNWPHLLATTRALSGTRRRIIVEQIDTLRSVWDATAEAIEAFQDSDRSSRPISKDRRPTQRSGGAGKKGAHQSAAPAKAEVLPEADAAESAAEEGPEIEIEGGPRRGWWQRTFGN